MPKRQAPKRELEEPGDLSISLAPAAPKKTKPAPVAVAKKTRSATKMTNSNNNTDSPSETPTLKQMQTISKPDEDPVHSQPTLATTKANTHAQPKKSANSTATAPKAQDDLSPAEPALSAAETRKGNRPKKPSAIVEKANQQEVAKQNAKEAKAAKKAKKAEVVVIEETPEETAAFLAKAKGQSQPVKTSPNVTSPKRQKLLVNRDKAMEQLLNAHVPPPNPASALSSTATTGNTLQTGVVSTDTSTPPAGKPKPRPKIVTQPSLHVPRSAPPSRDVSPVAPPLLDVPPPVAPSREVSPGAESMVTVDDDYDEDIDSGVNYQAILEGIPKPWNLGPVSMPPALPEPLHTVKLRPEVLEKATNGGKDKPKVGRPLVNNFRVQDQVHLKHSLEYMDALVATICAFPDDDMRWTFAVLSNYWASKKLGRNYRLDRQSDHCRLLYSRISQSRGRLVSAASSDGIRDNYDGLSWRPTTGLDKAKAENAIRARVASMIKDGSFTAPADRPTAYYQNPWFAHILKFGYWQQATSKGMSEAHIEHFGGGISYPLLALVVTATEKMLAVVAAGPNSGNSSQKNAANAFSHNRYAPRFHAHLLTLAKLHRSVGGPILTGFLTQLHKELRAPFTASVPSGHALQLAIPISALSNYGQAQPPAPITERSSAPKAPSARRPKVRTRSAASIDLGAILNDPSLNANQKLKLLSIIYTTNEDNSSQTHSARATRRYERSLTSVNADSDDSEVEAHRAGALSNTQSNAQVSVKIWMSDSDEGAIRDGDGDGNEAEAEDEGEVEAEATPESEPEFEFEPVDEGGNIGEGEGEDQSEVELIAEDGSEAEGAAGAIITTENEGETDEYDSGTRGSIVTKPRPRRFFPDPSLTDPPSPDSNSNSEADSDGEGASGAIATQVDGDQTMRTAVASDTEED